MFKKADSTRKEPLTKIDTIAGIVKGTPQEARPAPLPLEVEPSGLDDMLLPVLEASPPVAKPLAGSAGAGEVSFAPITPGNEAETAKAEELFTKPGPILTEKKIQTIDLGKTLGKEKEAAPGKSSDFMGIFDRQEDEEDSSIRELIASMPEVKMPEILNEAGVVKELIADLSQRDWVKAAKGDVKDAYTIRSVSKGGKDDGKRPQKASR